MASLPQDWELIILLSQDKKKKKVVFSSVKLCHYLKKTKGRCLEIMGSFIMRN